MSGTPDLALLALLSDGRWHSGEALGQALGKSRAAVWKGISALRQLGVDIEAATGRGYRWAQPVELLDPERIRARLSSGTLSMLASLEVLASCDSTSARLQAAPAPEPGCIHACLAEYQTGGRGRRGRRWLSPPAAGLCLSVGWSFVQPPPGLAGLGLAAGVIALEAMEASGARGLSLKWPNDILGPGGGKLAGILVDLRGESGGPLAAVIGLGVNLSLPPALVDGLAAEANARLAGTPEALLAPAVPLRNELAARLLDGFAAGLDRFARSGFAAFADRWRGRDALSGQPVRVILPSGEWEGIARGIDADGALLLERDGELASVLAGDVSLRVRG
ncbi:MAG: biotin--[acetyl-CoA-carboxylase] ligase [Chromatiales bacterium]|nr:biotin--[acetyl-CoA-carboxylase] ligase [Chromatiales bacterium]